MWGEAIPAWLAAVGTVGTAGLSVVLAWSEHKRADRAESERDALREAMEQGVASRVAGWLSRAPRREGQGPRRFGDSYESWRANVKNGADQVIRDVRAYVVHSDGALVDRVHTWDIVPPGEVVSENHNGNVVGYNETPYLRVTFTDPSGRRWCRGLGGALAIATDDDDKTRS